MAKVAKKGAGGLVESLSKKAVRGYLKEASEGKEVKKIPSLKFDRLKGADRGIPGEGGQGEYNREATGLTLGQQEALDDMNSSKEFIRKQRAESAPVLTPGKEPPEVEFPEKYVPGKKWKGIKTEKRGGGIELGKVGGSKSKRRMDKKAR